MRSDVSRRLAEAVTPGPLGRAVVVLTPLLLATLLSGNATWLQAGLVTISTFIAMDRSGLAPLGVVLHGAAVLAGFLLHPSSPSPARSHSPRRWWNGGISATDNGRSGRRRDRLRLRAGRACAA